MTDLRLGINLWSQASDWPTFLAAGVRAEKLGYDHLWTWDHLYAIFGDPYQPIHEGYVALAALAQATSRIRLAVSGANLSGLLKANDTAVFDTPASRATSAMRGRRGVRSSTVSS